ncbi:hypothetical protein EQH57_0223, partial [Dictyocoela roeselum]
NKKAFPKSLYFNFSVSGCTYGGDPDSLNSRKKNEKFYENIRRELESSKYSKKFDDRFDVATFKHKDDSTGLKILHKINILGSIEHQDVLNWSLAFMEVARVCQWNANAQIEVLKHSVAIDIQYKIGGPTDANDYINALLKLKYNANSSYIYYEKLLTINQNIFYTIRKYAHEIEITCRKHGLCMGWNDSLLNQKFEESFMNGLDKRVKLELSKFFKKDYKSIYESILSTEQMLIENIQKEMITYERYEFEQPDKFNGCKKLLRERYGKRNTAVTSNQRHTMMMNVEKIKQKATNIMLTKRFYLCKNRYQNRKQLPSP